jgi:hypothetical protein
MLIPFGSLMAFRTVLVKKRIHTGTNQPHKTNAAQDAGLCRNVQKIIMGVFLSWLPAAIAGSIIPAQPLI